MSIAKNLPSAGAFIEHKDSVADAGFDGGHGDEVAADRLSSGIDAINHQEPAIIVIGVVDRRRDFTGYLAYEHGSILQLSRLGFSLTLPEFCQTKA